jgi:formate dehydrogenase gamma subunit
MSSRPPKTRAAATGRKGAPAGRRVRTAAGAPRSYERFHWSQRLAHGTLIATFTTLAVTGLAQKYPLARLSEALIALLGGIESTRLIHHAAAILLMLLAIYHLLDVGYRVFVRRVPLSMLPGVRDLRDGWQSLKYNLGLARQRPQMGRYTFEEKLEYWSLVWGTVIMALTGFIMWNPILSSRLLPGEIIPAAKAAHGGEALLAVAAIIIWHMYAVHIKRFNRSMFTGRLSVDEMLHEHPLELADLKAGAGARDPSPAALRRRRAVYFPAAGLLAAALLAGVYGFIGAEDTAPERLPTPTVLIYAPQTATPLPTSSPAAPESLTWNGYVGPLLQQKCGLCHGPAGTTGLALDSYAGALAGAPDGPVILSGDSAGSRLIVVQAGGDHPVSLSADELENVARWIDAGAPEDK